MPFFQPVKPGEPVTHSARRENAISSMLNTFSDLSACGAKPGAGTAFRIAVCNQTETEIPAGCAVECIPGAAAVGDALPVRIATGMTDFFIASETMSPGACSGAVVMGVVSVTLANPLPDDCKFVVPDEAGSGKFIAASSGPARVISATDSTAMILIGGSGCYSGNFAVTLDAAGKLRVGPGWLNRNGIFYGYVEQSSGGITPKTGILCITSRPVDKRGNWSDPVCEILDSPNQLAYPLAEITVAETAGTDGKMRKSIGIRQFPVTVATILYAARCPIAEL